MQEAFALTASHCKVRPVQRSDFIFYDMPGRGCQFWFSYHSLKSHIRFFVFRVDVDCTVFFEIYHASKQSFLYLKEFYLGEVDPQDKHRIPYPNPNGPAGFVSAGSTGSGDIDGGVVRASDAFMEQLRRVTPWRLKDSDMIALEAVTYKSF
jgi:hypothetical protein